VRSALLRGRDHTELGAIVAEAEGRAAAAISRGGAPKRYPHVDPNEDAALFASGPGGTLLAVADAHEGFAAAELALDHLLTSPAGQWTAESRLDAEAWQRHVVAALLDANQTIHDETRQLPGPHSCTTLSLVVVRPAQQLLFYASLGDSHLFQVGSQRVDDLGVHASRETRRKLGSYFLGFGPETTESLSGKCLTGALPLADTQAVLLVTDGISERGIGVADPPAAMADVVGRASGSPEETRPLAAARGVVEVALASHVRRNAGDNVACAVLWLA
jgi:serine/threonine protein phosphatase PrpC